MNAITKEQIKRLYALGSGLGLVGRGRDDLLHALVLGMTGKESISSLIEDEFMQVQRELLNRMRLANRQLPEPKARKQQSPSPAGMMTREQQALAWRLVYRLQELDPKDRLSCAAPGERMCGAVKKILGVHADVKEPFRWVNFAQGQQLIEQLKRYVRSAERREAKQNGARPAGRAHIG